MNWITNRPNNKNWHAACCELVSQMSQLKNLEHRLGLLREICHKLGYEGYPVFLKMLCFIEVYGDKRSRSLLTETVRHGLQTNRLPTGPLPGWGSPVTETDRLPSQAKQHGPIEYICIWYTQPTVIGSLDDNNFKTCLCHLLRLLSIDTETIDLYSKKLLSDANDPLSGSFSSSTRRGLSQLATDWLDGDTPESVSSNFLAQISKAPFSELDRQTLLRQL